MHTHQGLTKHHNIIVPCNYFGMQAVINYHHYNLVPEQKITSAAGHEIDVGYVASKRKLIIMTREVLSTIVGVT